MAFRYWFIGKVGNISHHQSCHEKRVFHLAFVFRSVAIFWRSKSESRRRVASPGSVFFCSESLVYTWLDNWAPVTYSVPTRGLISHGNTRVFPAWLWSIRAHFWWRCFWRLISKVDPHFDGLVLCLTQSFSHFVVDKQSYIGMDSSWEGGMLLYYKDIIKIALLS